MLSASYQESYFELRCKSLNDVYLTNLKRPLYRKAKLGNYLIINRTIRKPNAAQLLRNRK